jgi:hypothetical protein
MTNGSGSVGTTVNVDTHQMKNVEWGAVAYLTQSIYGKSGEVWINPYGDTTSWKMKTGYAGSGVSCSALAEGNASLAQFNTGNGPNASTTGNVYGKYDMSGGAWERTAAFIDNGNNVLGTNGISSQFTNNKLISGNEKYYDIYEPGDQEKEGGLYYGAGIDSLWNADGSVANNTTRKALTVATYAKMSSKKGDGTYETSSSTEINYNGKKSDGNYDWFKNATDTVTNYAGGWNSDYQLYGHGNRPWFIHGGGVVGGINAGVFAVGNTGGSAYMGDGFRPVLITGESL